MSNSPQEFFQERGADGHGVVCMGGEFARASSFARIGWRDEKKQARGS